MHKMQNGIIKKYGTCGLTLGMLGKHFSRRHFELFGFCFKVAVDFSNTFLWIYENSITYIFIIC